MENGLCHQRDALKGCLSRVAFNKSIVLFLSVVWQNILTFDTSALRLMVYLFKIRRRAICPGGGGNKTQGQLITNVGN